MSKAFDNYVAQDYVSEPNPDYEPTTLPEDAFQEHDFFDENEEAEEFPDEDEED